jgi:hypothetical protein
MKEQRKKNKHIKREQEEDIIKKGEMKQGQAQQEQ